MGEGTQITGMSHSADDKMHLVVQSSFSDEQIHVIYDLAASRITHVNLISGTPSALNLNILTGGVSGKQIRANMLALMPSSSSSAHDLYQALIEDELEVDGDQDWHLLFESLNIAFVEQEALSFDHRFGMPAMPIGVDPIDHTSGDSSPVTTSSSSLPSEPSSTRMLQDCSSPLTTPTQGSTFTYFVGDAALSESFDTAFSVSTSCNSLLSASSTNPAINSRLQVSYSTFEFN